MIYYNLFLLRFLNTTLYLNSKLIVIITFYYNLFIQSKILLSFDYYFELLFGILHLNHQPHTFTKILIYFYPNYQ